MCQFHFPIWYVSTAGSDSNVCNIPESPCLTINGAIAKAADGDTVRVAVGTYTAMTAAWKNNSQPTMGFEESDRLEITLIPDLSILPDLQLPFDAFTVEPVE